MNPSKRWTVHWLSLGKSYTPVFHDDHIPMMIRDPRFGVGFLLMILGIAITFGVVMLIILQTKGEVRGGGIIMIGPIPIIFGSDSKIVKGLIVIAIVLMVVLFGLSLTSAFTGRATRLSWEDILSMARWGI
jgi:uncharacterized protein (TIGR00304 family)